MPPRPQLSYSLQQRRAIVDGLVADREMARYTDQVVRYRTGQSSLPPPSAPPTVVADAVPEGLVGPVEPAATEPGAPTASSDAGGRDVFAKQFDDDTLDTFVDQLARSADEERPANSEPAADDAGDQAPGFFDWLGGLFGRTKAKAAEPAAEAGPGAAAAPAPAPAATPEQPDRLSDAAAAAERAIEAAWVDHAAPAPTRAMARSAPANGPPAATGATIAQAQAASPTPVPKPRPAAVVPTRPDPGATGIAVGAEGIAIGTANGDAAALPAPRPEAASSILVLFQPGSASLPAGVNARLEQMLATAKAQGAVIRIEGAAAGAPALALDRAHAVALGLMRLGASARDLQMTLAPGASADQARLVLAGPAAR